MSKRRKGYRTMRAVVTSGSAGSAARRRRNVMVAMIGFAVILVLILSTMAGPLGGSGTVAAGATATAPPLVVLPSDQPYVTILPIAP